MMRQVIGAAVLFCWSISQADISMPAIFGDHMMLQQKTGAPIWGWAEAGEKIIISGSWGEKASTTAGSDGAWKVFLQTPSYGGPYELTVEGENRLSFSNVMIGEV